jgi:hypothetical protein
MELERPFQYLFCAAEEPAVCDPAPQNRRRERGHRPGAILIVEYCDAAGDQAAFHFINRASADGVERHPHFIEAGVLTSDKRRQNEEKNRDPYQMPPKILDTWLQHDLTFPRARRRVTGERTDQSLPSRGLALRFGR